MSNIINLNEKRLQREQARKAVGHAAAMSSLLELNMSPAPTPERLATRQHLIDEAVHEMVARGQPWNTADVMALALEWENQL